MKKVILSFLSITVLSLLLFGVTLFAQGKYLRGEVWQKFLVENAVADFYVSPKGNDSWSGTLAEANSSKDDGPFKTIARAQEAVKELKKKVYKPEGIP